MKRWVRLTDMSYNYQMRIIEEDFSDEIEYELTLQNTEALFTTEYVTTITMDLPGPIWLNRHIETINIDGFEFKIPSQDWQSLLYSFKLEQKQKLSNGTEYYSLQDPGLLYSLILTTKQRDFLIKTMEDRLEEVKEQGDLDDLEFARRIASINQNYGYSVIESSRAKAIDEANEGKKNSN